MSGEELVLRGRRVLTPEGIRPAAVRVRFGRIVSVEPFDSQVPESLDAGEAVVLPGLVDTHIHINEPGRTEWEGFETATRAAAAGVDRGSPREGGVGRRALPGSRGLLGRGRARKPGTARAAETRGCLRLQVFSRAFGSGGVRARRFR